MKKEKIENKEIKVIPIKMLVKLNQGLLKNNNKQMIKKDNKQLQFLSKIFYSNMHYLNKMMINQNLDPEEIEVSEERIKEMINYGN